ncbi:MAG: tRNA1(Val) (adenine(37)-N6)-methyltransferase [Desulfobacterales bacterium]|mgnify:CR=1 FL=1|jgi:tRNA1Val (adenine37-N6)-methyltransferase|nr:tRNA1(Val) (adenine(37)-N6)-methyltransferase [Desulfobacteraceae bacterium]MBT4364140.1 tRNA1(Val) (adenine(37)-N6)-methyltransferase [Desulfobacteraceae bacterium]MBT7085065.1 tRNA1(Val) (adenine(37)-N6)-methyltransferase [Desulfobacterales bacterium]MBT7698621.1 tRNA1(Val) (adenine(37)-N6)-methyltransferase [Desulfobacterales bacterium]
MSEYTTDTFFDGQISVTQESTGYRFSIDPILLAWHARPAPGDKILDLGTGCGIIPLMLAYRNPETIITGIEIQPSLAKTAALNIKENNMGDRIKSICCNMKNINQSDTGGPVDLIVSNPPYRKTNSGRVNPNQQKAIARHEIEITINEIMETSRSMLRTMGKFITIYPAERSIDLLAAMRKAGIEPKMLRTIHSYENTEAVLIIAEGVKRGNPGIKIMPPLIIYKAEDVYSDEVKKMYIP